MLSGVIQQLTLSGTCGCPSLLSFELEKTPQVTVVVCNNRSLTYAELRRSANQVARYLEQKSVGSDTLLGLCVERCVRVMIARSARGRSATWLPDPIQVRGIRVTYHLLPALGIAVPPDMYIFGMSEAAKKDYQPGTCLGHRDFPVATMFIRTAWSWARPACNRHFGDLRHRRRPPGGPA